MRLTVALQDVAEQVGLISEVDINTAANHSDFANTWSTPDVHLHLSDKHSTHHFTHLNLV